jgi:hypothetical protein
MFYENFIRIFWLDMGLDRSSIKGEVLKAIKSLEMPFSLLNGKEGAAMKKDGFPLSY